LVIEVRDVDSILIKNGLLVTMDRERRIIEDGGILVEGQKISKIGKMSEFSGVRADEEIDAKGCIVMPGLICSHTHLYGMLLRGAPLFAKIKPPTDFMQNLQWIWWPVDEALTHDDAYASALVGCLEFLKTGTTLFADTYSGPNSIEGVLDRIGEAVERIGIRGFISFEATERHSREEGERGVKECIRYIEKVGDKGRVRGMLCLHASFTVSDDLLKLVREKANELKVPITMHTSEGLVDVYHNLERYGKRTVERLRDVGFLGRDVVLAHCVHLNDDELKILAETGTNVAHNPMSNMLNAVGVAAIPKMIDMGIRVGLGNDGYIFDGFENIRAAYLLHKVHYRDPRMMAPLQVLEMATIKGAELYGVQEEVGSLEVGKLADIIIIKPDVLPTPLNSETVYGHLVNTVDGDDVQTVIVDGRILMRDRKVLTVDEDEVERIAQRSAERLWDRLKEVKPELDRIR